MEPTDGPKALGDRLRILRERAGLTGRALADVFGWQPPKVSKIELGKQMPTAAEVEAWARATGADTEVEALLALRDVTRTAHVRWKEQTRRGGLLGVQADYEQMVADSAVLRNFETMWVPGLLQVSDYSRQVFIESAALHGADDVEAALAGRARRQEALYAPGRRFEFLLAEPVLRWLICPPPVMRSQLDRLQAAVGVPNLRLGVLPLSVPVSTPPQNSFAVFVDAEGEAQAVVESFDGEARHTGEVAALYSRVMDRLWADAVEGEAVRPLLDAAARVLPAG